MRRVILIAAAVSALVVFAACASGDPPIPTAAPLPPTATMEPTLPAIDLGRLYQVLETDEIEPVYDPVFETAGRTRLGDEQLVMGVAINGEAKAYPVSLLQFREMVNDEVGGTPVLVTW